MLSGLSAYVQQAKLTASDGAAGAFFGGSVSISGNTMVVGADSATVGGDNYQGAAYVFTESGSRWTQTAKLTASDGAAYADFGGSVSISGNTIVVGANGATVGGIKQGAAYVFTGSGSSWTQTAKLTASDGTANANFGFSVSISGNTAVVGANGAVVGGINQGAAYVFTGSGSAWAQAAELTASDGTANAHFGISVAISGNTIVVGAYDATVNSINQGAAYVFVEPAGGWAGVTQPITQQAELTASDGTASDWFGRSVAISGSTLVVGAPAPLGGINPGAAYVFAEPSGGWAGNLTQTAELTSSDGHGGYVDGFGISVSISGNTVVVGAYLAWGGNVLQGAAYVFAEPASGWANMTQTQKLTASDGAANDWFGFSVSFSGSTLVVGAPVATVGGNFGQGAAYVFGSANLGLSQTSLPPDTINVAYNDQTITAVGGTGTVKFSVGKISGAISGLTVTSSGTGVTISGTPTATGTETFAVTAKDQGGNTASATYSITVNPILTLGATPLPAGTLNQSYGFLIPSSGGTGPDGLGVTMVASNVQNPIPGVSISGGTVSGTPTATGTETFTITATDAVGYTTSASYSLTIITTPTAWSRNWSGYTVTASPGAVTDVKGSWIVPALQSPSAAGTYAAFWVGIDGWNSSTVQQTGTMMYTNASGQAAYYAWYEMYPNGMVRLSMTIHPGDQMSGEVQYIGSNEFTLTLTDVTTKTTFSTTQTMSSAQRSSAEWIAEAPSAGSSILPLANFATASFSAASATIGGTTGPIDSTAWPSGNPIAITMVDGTTESYPSSLVDNPSGTSSAFSVTWAGRQGVANGAMMPSQPGNTAALSNPSAFLPLVTTGFDGTGYAAGTRLQPKGALVTSASLMPTAARTLGDGTVRALPDEAVDLALVDFKGIGPDGALLSVLAAGRMRSPL